MDIWQEQRESEMRQIELLIAEADAHTEPTIANLEQLRLAQRHLHMSRAYASGGMAQLVRVCTPWEFLLAITVTSILHQAGCGGSRMKAAS